MTAERTVRTLLVLALALGALAAGYWQLRRPRPAAAETDAQDSGVAPVASVQTVPIVEGSVDSTLTAFGTVEAASEQTRAFTVPFEARVARVYVVGGQNVSTGDPLLDVEPSPDTRLQLDEARKELSIASNQLALARQQFGVKLVTKGDVLQAEQVLAGAELRATSLNRGQREGATSILAASSSIVSRVDVQAGQIVPAGSPLVETVSRDRIRLRLGVEQEDAVRLHTGQPVDVEPVDGQPDTVNGRIEQITGEVDPHTRLVNVYVTLPAGSRLFINEYVRGRIVADSRRGLVVPAAAVLPEGDAHVLYSIENGHAVRHEVRIALEGGRRIVLEDTGLRTGQQVVVVGNSQLKDGMAVKVERAQ